MYRRFRWTRYGGLLIVLLILSGGASGRIPGRAGGHPAIPPPHHPFDVNAVAFAPDGRQLASGEEEGTVRLWDAETGALRQILPGTGRVTCVAFSPDGRLLAAGYDRTQPVVRVWKRERETFRPLHTLPIRTGAGCLAFAPGGRILACGTRGASYLHLFDPVAGAQLLSLHVPSNAIEALQFTRDGKTLVTGGAYVSIWDMTALNLGGTGAETVESAYDPGTGRPHHALRRTFGGYWIRGVAVTPDGTRVVSAGHLPGDHEEPKRVVVWATATGEKVRVLADGPAEVTCAAVTSDGRQTAVGSVDGVVRVWEIETGQLTHTFHVTDAEITAVALASNGQTLAASGRDGAVRLWNLTTGHLLRTLRP